jgi:hypothetical protein
MRRFGSLRRRKALVFALVALAFLLVRWYREAKILLGDGISDRPAVEAITAEEAFQGRRSGVMIEGVGKVMRILADDREGSRHQRFILLMESGQTLLVSHNIDLAERVPIRPGDRLEVRGQYEWNDRGGVVHWTHHDPEGRRNGGWIRFGNREYR